ncbi:MAG: serine hydrolase [Candidatus Koribacter versatilis]|uniref:beta-lactamase n=1 Tax=Candidatus Korobacter versatilis TaxID=658062 RepID=A0A932A767_9BACT|nr:serine hydrolase [Candidatus Koribacter versatilis]
MANRLLVLFIAAQLAAVSVFAASPPVSKLQTQLNAIARAHHGKVALFARHLRSGQTVEIDADRAVRTASVIKLAIMLEAFVERKEGKISFAKKLKLRAEDKVPGSGVLTLLRPGLEITLDDAIVLMMDVSDNTATNLVIDELTIPAINARLGRIGLKETRLYKKPYLPAETPIPAGEESFGIGKSTAREMARIMEVIGRCDLQDQEYCTRMVDIMRNQQFRYMIPRLIERSDASETTSAIADKIGELDDSRNDVALVFTKSGPIVISIFTWDNKDRSWTADNEAYLTVARLAKAIVDAWSPGGLPPGVKDKAKAGEPPAKAADTK